MTKPNPPPVVVAINRFRELAGLTTHQAARRAEISEAQWRLYTAGHRTSRGNTYAVQPSQEMLARMALAAGMPPDQLGKFPNTDEAVEYLRILESRSLEHKSADDLLDEIDARVAALRALLRPRQEVPADVSLRGIPGYVDLPPYDDDDEDPVPTSDLDAKRRQRTADQLAGEEVAAARPDERDLTLSGGVGIDERPATEPSPTSPATRRDGEKG